MTRMLTYHHFQDLTITRVVDRQDVSGRCNHDYMNFSCLQRLEQEQQSFLLTNHRTMSTFRGVFKVLTDGEGW